MATPTPTNATPEMTIKILVIGESAVGKSCILLRYTDDFFQEDSLSTIGVDFKIKKEVIDGSLVKIQIWDTAGQERFRNICKAYYRGTQGILLVFDVNNRDSFEKTITWITSIKENVANTVDIILVGNKADNPDEDAGGERKVSKEEGQKMAESLDVPYFETSAKTGRNVNEVFIKMATMVKARKDKDTKKQEPTKPAPKKEKKGCC